MRKTVKFIVMILLLFLQSAVFAAAPPSLSLSSLSDDWMLTLLFGAKDSCKVEGKPAHSKTAQTRAIDAIECKTLKKDLEDLKVEIANHTVALQKPAAPSRNDQTEFQLESGGVKFYQHLIAPAVCDMDKEGKMKCTPNDLSGGQRLLLRMLDYVQSMKLGVLPRRK